MLKNEASTKGYDQKWGQPGRSGVALKIVAGRIFVSKDTKEVPGTQMLTDQIKGSTDQTLTKGRTYQQLVLYGVPSDW